MAATATENEFVETKIAAELGEMRVGCAAVVESYNQSEQVATVKPVISTRFASPEDGEGPDFVEPPPIERVPVLFPSGGGGTYSITWPLQPGDTVYLCQADRSHDEWQASANETNEPVDARRFDLTDSFAIPGGRSPADALSSDHVDGSALTINGDTIKLGSSTGTNPVALANKVADWLATTMKTFLEQFKTTYNAHTHIDPISGTTGPPTAPFTNSTPNPSTSNFESETTEST